MQYTRFGPMLEMAEGQDVIPEQQLEVERVELLQCREDVGTELSHGPGRNSSFDARGDKKLLASKLNAVKLKYRSSN